MIEPAPFAREGASAKEVAQDEDFWFTVRRAYDITPEFIHLESGWFSAVSREVQDAQFRYMSRLNTITSFYLRRQYDEDKVQIKRAMGRLAGLSPDEFVICRNTTEALDTVILGLDLERGDEIVWCEREYPSMKDPLAQRAGLMYVRKDKISKVWPLFADRVFPKDDIRKFEHIGTHPVAIEQALLEAIQFHESLGAERKEERLRYLKNYWVERVLDLPKVVINTPLKDHQSCGIANVGIEGKEPKAVADYFYNEHRVFTVAVDQGVRVSPNLFTRLSDLDALVTAIRELAA